MPSCEDCCSGILVGASEFTFCVIRVASMRLLSGRYTDHQRKEHQSSQNSAFQNLQGLLLQTHHYRSCQTSIFQAHKLKSYARYPGFLHQENPCNSNKSLVAQCWQRISEIPYFRYICHENGVILDFEKPNREVFRLFQVCHMVDSVQKNRDLSSLEFRLY